MLSDRQMKLSDAIAQVSEVRAYIDSVVTAVQETQPDPTKAVQGAQGSVSTSSAKAMRLLERSMIALRANLQTIVAHSGGSVDVNTIANTRALTTLHVEHWFSLMRRRYPCPTMLQYCQLKSPTMRERFKQLSDPGYLYVARTYLPDVAQSHCFRSEQIPRIPKAKATISKLNRQLLLHYCHAFLKPVPQNRVR